MTLDIKLNKIQNIYNTFRKYSFYKNKLEKYLSSNKIYLIMKRNDNDNDNYSKLILAIKKRSKSLFLPMINQFYIMMCLLKASSNIFKFFKSVNLDNLKKLLKETHNYNHEELLNEYFSISYKYRKHISYRFLNEDIFIFHVKSLKYKYYNKSNSEAKNRNCFDTNCRYIKEATKYKLDFYMENDIKKRNEILNNFFISSGFKDYYSCIYNNCYKEFLLSLKTSVIYQYTIYCLKIDCKNKYQNKYQNKYNSLMSSFKSSNYTFDEFADLIKSYWIFLNMILI